MCMMGPIPQSLGVPQPAKAKVVEPGPPSPNDKVDGVEVGNITDRSQQETRRQENRGGTATRQKGQTSSRTDKAY